jgi:hypothetical protein
VRSRITRIERRNPLDRAVTPHGFRQRIGREAKFDPPLLQKEPVMTAVIFHIPRRSELQAVNRKTATADIKPLFEKYLDDDLVIDRIEPFIFGEGVEGNKVLDMDRAVGEITRIDDEHGGTIRAAPLFGQQRIQQLLIVLRRRFILDKHWKVIGINEKRFVLTDQRKAG